MKTQCQATASTCTDAPQIVYWLQAITILWMLAECALSLYAAWSAQSAALLAFGGDSLVELLSAGVVLFSVRQTSLLSRERAARASGVLLFLLAAVVACAAVTTLVHGSHPEASWLGIGVSIAALIVMPALAWLKRKTARTTGNQALAADAVQSATCAYLAAITLAGLAANSLLHIQWLDPVAALAALPILAIEGRRALQGEVCGCGH